MYRAIQEFGVFRDVTISSDVRSSYLFGGSGGNCYL